MHFTKPGSWPGYSMHPREISIHNYTYSLPDHRIAHHPLPERDQSKLLVYQNGKISDDQYRQLASYLPGDSLILFNNTKVVEARLLFQKSSGANIEIFCLAPHEQYADITTALQTRQEVLWQCLVGGASKWKAGQVLEKEINWQGQTGTLFARFEGKRPDSFIIRLSWDLPALSFAEILHAAGAIPLPPYIKRKAELDDASRYQTIYAKEEGSVAAPTAGLHFTDSLMQSLQQKNIQPRYLTLHVGAGTFKPVSADTMDGHLMHAEWMDVPIDLIRQIQSTPIEKITAVGTTSMRTLESLYWSGVKIISGKIQTAVPPTIDQWEIYDTLPQDIPATEAFMALINWMGKNKLNRLVTPTRLLIAPGYTFRCCRRLVTNFHQPASTLLLLVAALTGDVWKQIYDHALSGEYRFLSYGDGCLLDANAL